MATTRDRIIAATNELFRRQGYNGTSLSQISRASGATIGSIYHFFPGGKEALGVAVIETTGAAYRELFEAIAAETDIDDPAEAFRTFFTAAGVVLEESGYIDPCPIGTVAREVANTSEPLRLAAEAAFDSWVDAASTHLTRGGLGVVDADELGQVFVATVEGAFVMSRTRRDPDVLASAGRRLAGLVDRAVADRTGAT